jgi:hypothetical protein
MVEKINQQKADEADSMFGNMDTPLPPPPADKNEPPTPPAGQGGKP